jgi:hypothetical protein
LTTRDFCKAKGGRLYTKHKSIKEILRKFLSVEDRKAMNVPEKQAKHKKEHAMIRTLQQIFPNNNLMASYSHPDITFQSSRLGQLDAFIPSLALALEYQGEQHYGHSTFPRENLASLQQRDQAKRSACHALGITLIEVPYWWDGTRAQLAATIHYKRPDLVPIESVQSPPIPPQLIKSTETSTFFL